MSRFVGTLRRISDRLTIPQPARSRVLLEISADMEDLRRHYLDRGLGEEEAALRVESEFSLSEEALGELVGVHGNPLTRVLDGLSAQTRGRWERALLVLLLLFVAVVAGRLMLTREFFATASPLAWPILAGMLVALGLSAVKGYRLQIRRDHDPRRLRGGLNLLPMLGLGMLAYAFAGLWLNLGWTALRIQTRLDEMGFLLADWLMSSATLLITAHVCALLCGLLWFLLDLRVGTIEGQEAALLDELLAAK